MIVEARGVRFHVRDVGGSGPTVLLFHDAARSADDWARVQDALAARGYRSLAVDQRGHGASTRFGEPGNPWDGASVDAFVTDARALLPLVAPGGAHVVGHGFGGAVAAWLAYWEGVPRVRSLAVAATPPQVGEAYRAWHGKAAAAGVGAGYEGALADAMHRMLARADDDDYPAELMTQFKERTLVMEGSDDPSYNPSHTMLWYAWVRNGGVTRIAGGHDFPFDGGEGEKGFTDALLAHLVEAESS